MGEWRSLAGVALGSVLTFIGTWLHQRHDARDRRATALAEIRRETEIAAAISVHHVTDAFGNFFAHNWNHETTEDPDAADQRKLTRSWNSPMNLTH